MVEPRSVMVLRNDGRLVPCSVAHDNKVAGVISGAGQYKPGIVLGHVFTSDPIPVPVDNLRQPIAPMGKVFCWVDADVAAIDVGDLLTTSATPGHAMKVLDPSRSTGSILGKAMGPLTGGRALIPILVSLQ